jgi:hypothetical protein
MNSTDTKPISELFLDVVKTCLDEETFIKVTKSLEEYDRPFFDKAESGTVITVSKWGSTSLTSFRRFVQDPWSAKHAFKGQGAGYFYFEVLTDDSDITHVMKSDADEAGIMLYRMAKAASRGIIPEFNNVHGYMVSFDELRGSIPEHMRDVFETKVFDETTGTWKQPNVVKLREWYDRERDTILAYLRTTEVRVQIGDRDDPTRKEWVPRKVSKIGFCFNRFDYVADGARQSTAFFSVSDDSPEFAPDVSYNWFLQDTARWMYAGALAINYSRNDETGEETIDISSHH